MKNSIKIVLSLILILNFQSCSNDDVLEDTGISTVLKGNVSDNIRGIKIEGYKIVLVKSWSSCSNWMCGIESEEIATTYTDSNGNYEIQFDYKSNDGKSYGLLEQYYGFPYYPEYLQRTSIVAGEINLININAWKPIKLELNVEVLNNNYGPLHVRNEIDNSDNSFLNTENIYEQNVFDTYSLRSKPDTDIKIIFWYYIGENPVRVLHQKTILYHTTLDDVNTLNFTIDCSTF